MFQVYKQCSVLPSYLLLFLLFLLSTIIISFSFSTASNQF